MATEDLEQEQGRRATPYRAVWRWHFYAGVFAAPVLIVLAITGALYLFDRELDHVWNRDLDSVVAAGPAQPLATQEAAVRAAFPGGTVARLTLPAQPDRASRWLVKDVGGTETEVFVDPYRAAVLGDRDPHWQPLNVVRDLHGNLLTGRVGSHLVELTACWTLLMLVTGVYLWWPRRWRLAAFVPRTAASGRAFWRDWHAIPSTLNALLVMFLVLTGLPWSAFWGVQFARLGAVVPFVAPSPNFVVHVPEHEHETAGVPWTVRHHAAPAAAATGTDVGIGRIETLLPQLDMPRHGPGARVFYPPAPGGVYQISYVPDRAQGQRTIYVDRGSGAVRESIGWADYSPVAKTVEWGVMTHMGRQYGLANQLTGLAACVTLVATVGAGLVLWWRRRPAGSFGAPQLKAGNRLPRPLVVTIAALAVLFPLLGASVLLVLGIEALRRYAASSDSGAGRPMAKP
jgi:uncharacterized iron-regulated membrane protein